LRVCALERWKIDKSAPFRHRRAMKRLLTTLVLAALPAAALADPLTDALSAEKGPLCFTRAYDRQWIEGHPGQTVRQVRFALSPNPGAYSAATMRVLIEGEGKPQFLFGECGWMEGDLNRGVQNDILDPSFKPTSGVGCHMYTDVTGASAEEGGDFPVEWGSGAFIQAHLPENVAAWLSYDVSRNADFFDVRPQDRIVRLNRAPTSECRDLVERFAPGEPR